MSYLGNTPSETFHQATSQVFNGDGSTTAFTLEKRVNRAEEIEVFVNNIQQQPTVAYSANNTTLTFTEAPDSATGNIYVVYRMFAQQNTFNALHDFTDAVTMASTLAVTGNTTVGGTLGSTGVLTANAGVKVDNITIDGTEIDLSSGDLTVDVAGTINLNADSGSINLADASTTFAELINSSSDFIIKSSQSDKDIIFKGVDGGSLVEAMRIDMSLGGFVGIGNSGPSTKLHVRTAQASNIAGYRGGTTGLIVEGDTASYIQLVADENAPMGILFDGGSSTTDTARMGLLADLNGTFGELTFKAGGSVRASITGAGNVVFHGDGTNIRQTFYTNGNISIGEDQNNRAGMYIQTHLQSYNGMLIKNGTNNGGGLFINFAKFDLGGVGSISQTANGQGVSFNTSSDYRLKENISDMTDATTRLKQLKPRRFNFIDDDSNTLVDGFLAHEVSDIVPEAISGEKDAVDDEGNIKPQGIDQSKLVPLLVKTIQELETRITALEGA